ncbi:complement C1q-like protein 2 isoform X1 [Pecten maximus]|uniref:complement C1q-like protein 2 isoform X1 n=1 Tax=Pecten maximus TaxID=6579 RepID=UPI001458C9B0|nr:complement C1q-like protein 2 isoform X1 [Pecten maximus]
MLLIYVFSLFVLSVCTSDDIRTLKTLVPIDQFNALKLKLENLEAEHKEQLKTQSGEIIKLQDEVAELRHTVKQIHSTGGFSERHGEWSLPLNETAISKSRKSNKDQRETVEEHHHKMRLSGYHTHWNDTTSSSTPIPYIRTTPCTCTTSGTPTAQPGTEGGTFSTNTNITNGASTRSQVSFYARLSTSFSNVTEGEGIIFQTIITNDGLGYSGSSGIFTCPVEGMYVFSVTIVTIQNKLLECSLEKNGRMVGRVYSGVEHFHNSGSMTVILHLNAGDHVNVHVYRSFQETGAILSAIYTTFSGFLLY